MFTGSFSPHFLTAIRKKHFENSMGKGENAGNQHFSLFPTMFFTLHRIKFPLI